MDHNLLLRASLNGLDADPEAIATAYKVSRAILDKFAHLLGPKYLIVWHTCTESGSRYFLPPITANGWQAMVPTPFVLGGMSWVEVSLSGKCQAYFSQRDLDSLSHVSDGVPDFGALTRAVEQSFQSAIAHLAHGGNASALKYVEKTHDSKVFERPPYELLSQKIMYAVAILAGVALFFLCLYFDQHNRDLKAEGKQTFGWTQMQGK